MGTGGSKKMLNALRKVQAAQATKKAFGPDSPKAVGEGMITGISGISGAAASNHSGAAAPSVARSTTDNPLKRASALGGGAAAFTRQASGEKRRSSSKSLAGLLRQTSGQSG